MANEEVQRCRAQFLDTLNEMHYPYEIYWEIVRKLGDANPGNKDVLRLSAMMSSGADALLIWQELKKIDDEKKHQRELRQQRQMKKENNG